MSNRLSRYTLRQLSVGLSGLLTSFRNWYGSSPGISFRNSVSKNTWNSQSRRCFEPLEPRVLLAGESLIISEFMASNDDVLTDEDGDFSDWIEIHNPTEQPVDLDGWHLTDDEMELNKWTFPAMLINPDESIIIFASDKDRTSRRGELHTNFRLSSAGEYLALVDPDLEIAFEYAPNFPEQVPNFSYGVTFNGVELIGESSFGDFLVPQDGDLGNQWTLPEFQIDQDRWQTRNLPLGFGVSLPETTLPGFSVRDVQSSNPILGIADAEALLAGEGVAGETELNGVAVINFVNAGSDGRFPDGIPYPSSRGDHFAMLSTATLVVAREGDYNFGLNHDDGGRLMIDGEVIIEDDVRRSSHEVFSSPIHLTAGLHTLEYLYFQSARSAGAELFYAAGESEEFKLLGDQEADDLQVFAITGNTQIDDIENQMRNVGSSAYLRIPFEIDRLNELDSLILRMQYDDGFAAYLNGTEVTRRNAPEFVDWQSTSSTANPSQQVFEAVEIDLSEKKMDLLNDGENILAIHGLNNSVSDDRFLLLPKLIGKGILTNEHRYFAEPTPGEVNLDELLGFVEKIDFSEERGFFSEPFQVTLTSETPGVEIRYTLDGRQPDLETGLVYRGPIQVNGTTAIRAAAFKSGFHQSEAVTQTYIFLDDVLSQQQNPDGFPSVWGSAGLADYEMDPQITVNTRSPDYDPRVKEALLSHPTISLVMDLDDLFDPTFGIYSNPQQDGVAWERPTSVEIIDPSDGPEIQVNAGLRIQGGASRNPNRPKHNMRLLFKGVYGAKKFEFPLFEDSPVESFDTFNLRGGNGDSWIHPNAVQNRQAQYIRDQWHRDIQREMGHLTPYQDYAHLYINGLYWGLYHTIDKPNASFHAEHLGGDKEDYDVLQHANGTVDGDRQAWNEMMAVARSGTQSNEAYENIRQYVDLTGLVDYLLINFYSGNVDWDQNNWFGGRKREPGAQFTFYTWDAERTFLGANDNRTTVFNNNQPSELHRLLMDNEEYRILFADRVQKHFFNGGLLTPEVAASFWEARAEEIRLPLVAEAARWGDSKRANDPYTPQDEWQAELDRLNNTYFPGRTETVLDQLRSSDQFPPVDAPLVTINREVRAGGQISPTDRITIIGGETRGTTAYYTLDGSDPRLPGGSINPKAIPYEDPFQLIESSLLKIRVRFGREWTALSEVKFFVNSPASADNLAVTEINYHPAAASPAELDAIAELGRTDFEFIELANTGREKIDLDGVRFVDGVSFEFGNDLPVTLEPGEHVLIVNNLDAFPLRYPIEIDLAGSFSGQLDNDGEQIVLLDRFGETIHDFTYNDGSLWPPSADGLGFTLEVIDTTGDYNSPDNWQDSILLGGSPGQDSNNLEQPARITAVTVSGSRWNPEFISQLELRNEAVPGHTVPSGLRQLQPLPWGNIDQIHITFDQEVQVRENDLQLSGISVSDYVAEIGFVADGFQYDGESMTAVWTLAQSIAADYLTIRLPDSVQDQAGKAIDGEWQEASQNYPSGDGNSGGDFIFSFQILPGDLSKNGEVDQQDLQLLRQSMLLQAGRIGYSTESDIDGSRAIDLRDLQILRRSFTRAVVQPLAAHLAETYLIQSESKTNNLIAYDNLQNTHSSTSNQGAGAQQRLDANWIHDDSINQNWADDVDRLFGE